MKNFLLPIMLVFLPAFLFSQPKRGVDSVRLIDDSLYQYTNGIKTFVGSVSIASTEAKAYVNGVKGSTFGFPVALKIQQPDNGSYATVIVNKLNPNVYIISYVGNDGDYWIEAHDAFNRRSIEMEFNPTSNHFGINVANRGTIELDAKGGKVHINGSVRAGVGGIDNGFNTIMLGSNLEIAGTNNFGSGQNGVIEPGVIGAIISGADGRIHAGANYSDLGNDANETWGIASFTRGFGNKAYAENGVTFGHNNVNGHSTNNWSGIPNKYISSLVGGNQSISEGNRQFIWGRAIHGVGDDIYLFGTGQDGTVNRLQAIIPGSFNIGFNGQMIFQVVKGGFVVINGIQYRFPVEQGAPGTVLTNDGNGNLFWGAPNSVTNLFGKVKRRQ